MSSFIKNLPHYGDILAIPFFFLLTYYFFQIENKNLIEHVLMILCFGAMLIDMLFTYLFVMRYL
jgi:hypothetical protein